MPVIQILAIGDVVGEAAGAYLSGRLRGYAREVGADMVIVNGENAAAQNGIDPENARKLFAAGADVITTGNHVWRKNAVKAYIETEGRLLRPANYPAQAPGLGSTIAEARGYRILVINVLGTVFMEPLACPFESVERILQREEGRYDAAVLDIHAEATSEKRAIAEYFDGTRTAHRLAAVFGTHTHVQTADAQILRNGTGFITDIGMTGPTDSVLGIRTCAIISKLKNKMPVRFEVAEGEIAAHGALISIDTDTAKTQAITPVTF